MKETPVPSEDPPVAEVYQLMVPADAAAPSVTEPVPQVAAGIVVATDGVVLIIRVPFL